MKKIISNITVNNKVYKYGIQEKKKGIVFIECKDANIAQDFLVEDVASLIMDLPNLIIAEKEHNKKQSEVVRFRISPQDKSRIEKRAIREGYKSLSDYMRHLALN